ncbi:MAG: SAM-dependent methyltransferase [Magnetococcales bacterium]|nr:SAM-dependent methyltransferase [Magnetococcales bacterium]
MARKYQITEELYNYAVEHSLKEPYITVELRDETFATERAARMVSSPEQMQFISMLLKILKPKKSIEIGVFTGYSTLWMAMALPDDAKIIACEYNGRYEPFARKYWQKAGVEHKIDLRIAKAHDTLDAILKNDNELETYDFIYIDADKLGYIDYLDKCHKLLRQGGLMIFDNVFLFGEVTKTEHVNDVLPNAMKEFNKHLHKDERFDISMLPLGDGMTLAYKK